MSPSIVLDNQGKVVYLAGSPGGSRIIGYVSKVLMMDFGYNPQEEVCMPHSQNQNGDTELETPIPGITSLYYFWTFWTLKKKLWLRGHTVVTRGGETSGLAIIQVADDAYKFGGADPRRDGTAAGRSKRHLRNDTTTS